MSKKVKTAVQFPGQRSGEEVELVFRQHPLVMRKALIFGLLAILVGVLPLDFAFIYSSATISGIFIKIALIIPVIVLAAWFYRWVGWYYTVYVVTDRRLVEIKQKGFFDRQVTEWQLDKILHVNYHIGGLQAVLFGFGDITVRTVIGDLVIPTIHNPTEIHSVLQEAVNRGRKPGTDSDSSTPFYN